MRLQSYPVSMAQEDAAQLLGNLYTQGTSVQRFSHGDISVPFRCRVLKEGSSALTSLVRLLDSTRHKDVRPLQL